MKLTHYELLCAEDRQLAVLGLTRSNNKGWMAKAEKLEWTEKQIIEFHASRKGPPVSARMVNGKLRTKKLPETPELFANKLYEMCGRDLSGERKPISGDGLEANAWL